jgi:hypothetical protein
MTVWNARWNPAYQTAIHAVTSTKCHIDTVISPDDGHIVARNMYRKEIKHTKKNCAPSWLYLQGYTRMRRQQNIENTKHKIMCVISKVSQFW